MISGIIARPAVDIGQKQVVFADIGAAGNAKFQNSPRLVHIAEGEQFLPVIGEGAAEGSKIFVTFRQKRQIGSAVFEF